MHRSAIWDESPYALSGAVGQRCSAMSRNRLLARTVCVLIAALAMSPNRQPTMMELLVAATPARFRVTEGRMSAGFEWRPAPVDLSTRSASARQKAVAGRILEDRSGAPESRHSAATAALLLTRPQEAIDALNSIAEGSRTPRMWSDLAAAFIARAQELGSPALLTDAVGAADSALEIDPALREALFNRALALERLGLRKSALTAWFRAVREANGDEWEGEVREHIRTLQAAAVPPFDAAFNAAWRRIEDGDVRAASDLVEKAPNQTRERLLQDELTEWAMLQRLNSDLAGNRLAVISTIALVIARRGDPFLSRYVSAIRAASDRDRLLIGEAQERFAEGSRLADSLPTSAESSLGEAGRLFDRSFEPMAMYARRFLAKSLYGQNRIEEAQRETEALLPMVAESPTLKAEVLWQMALCRSAHTDWGGAIEALEESASLYAHAREPFNVAVDQLLLSQIHDRIGDPTEAWSLRYAAMRELGQTTHWRTRNVVSAISTEAAVQRRWRVALSFLAIEEQIPSQFEDVLADTLLRRAAVEHNCGRTTTAAKTLAVANEFIAGMHDKAYRERAEADAMAVSALLAATPAGAVNQLTAAIDFHSALGRRMHLPSFYLMRGRALRSLGDRVRALRDFESGIAALESGRETLAGPELRVGVFEDAGELFTEAVSEALFAGDANRAFATAERARARTLLERMPEQDSRPLDNKTAIVELFPLRETVVLFVRTRDRVIALRAGASRDVIATAAERHREGLRNEDADAVRTNARILYEGLIAPIEPILGSGIHLVFVPDAVTSSLSFAALQNRDGRYLVEDHPISVSPSAAVYLRTVRSESVPSKVLVVAPDGDGDRLTGAADEAIDVASSYGRAVVLRNQAATAAAVLRAAPDMDAIHFAGHGRSRSDGARSTSLMLSGKGASLDASSVERLKLRRTSVVVLAACNSARGEVRWSEGTLSIARAFLAAGVPSVIATLLPIDDAEAAEFFPRLHKHLAAGMSPADALRSTQLEFIHRPKGRTATIWASVQAIGR
jgi:CHAT domain-containing protein